jgi:hypothetical protein
VFAAHARTSHGEGICISIAQPWLWALVPPQAHHKLTTSSLRATGSPSPIHTSTLGYSNYTLNAPPSTTRRSSISNLPKFLLSLQKFFHNYFHSNDLIQVLINQTVKLEEQGGAHGEAADAYACGC